MSAVATPSAPAWTMPEVRIGDTVYWYSGGDKNQQPAPAMVTQVNHRSVCLSIFAPNVMNLRCIDGVRHVGDPEAKDNEFVEDGAWDFRPPVFGKPRVAPLNKKDEQQ